MGKSDAEEGLHFQLVATGKTGWEREYRFHPTRRWRFDFANPDLKIAVEIEGMGGRHQTAKGFRLDIEKYDEAARLGWFLYRCTAQMVKSGRALETIEIISKARAA